MSGNDTWFGTFAKKASHATGQPLTFAIAAGIVVVWALLGPTFGFSDTWQLVINTGTTIITFLMVFLIQHTQNRDTVAIQIKLDELIRALPAARNLLLDLEEMEESAMERIRAEYTHLAQQVREGEPVPTNGSGPNDAVAETAGRTA